MDGILLGLDLQGYSQIVFGYIRYDDFWHFSHAIRSVYTAYQSIMHQGDYPPLTYPFEWETKQELYDAFFTIDPRVLKLPDIIWTCESPTAADDNTPCTTCKKCLELQAIQTKLPE